MGAKVGFYSPLTIVDSPWYYRFVTFTMDYEPLTMDF
jgi:hypothetical protein